MRCPTIRIAESKRMNFVVPVPSETFDVVLEDGASIRVRRHGNREGVRLTVTHGNGFASDAYLPFWQQLTPHYDVLVFDFRNHGQNVPVEPPNHNYAQLSRDLDRVRDAIDSRLGTKTTLGIFHSMSGRDEARHRDRLALGRAGSVRSAQCSAGRSSPLPADGGLREATDRLGARPPPPVRLGGGPDLRISAVARHQGLGIRRARAYGALGPAQESRWRWLLPRVRARERGRDLRRGADAQSVAARRRVRRTGETDRSRSEREECTGHGT